jgi:hypothetical protein
MTDFNVDQLQHEIDEAERYLRNQVQQTRKTTFDSKKEEVTPTTVLISDRFLTSFSLFFRMEFQ